jgi:hypothetical protein
VEHFVQELEKLNQWTVGMSLGMSSGLLDQWLWGRLWFLVSDLSHIVLQGKVTIFSINPELLAPTLVSIHRHSVFWSSKRGNNRPSDRFSYKNIAQEIPHIFYVCFIVQIFHLQQVEPQAQNFFLIFLSILSLLSTPITIELYMLSLSIFFLGKLYFIYFLLYCLDSICYYHQLFYPYCSVW